MKQIAEWAVLGMAVVAACTAMGDVTLSENVVLDAMRFDFVPARNPATGAVGLLNRLDGTLHPSGTVDANVRMSLDGNCGLSFLATGPSMA